MKNQNPIRLEKLRKRQELIDKGVDPYPHTWKKASWKKASGKKVKKPDKSKDLIKLFEGDSLSEWPMREPPMDKTDLTLQGSRPDS